MALERAAGEERRRLPWRPRAVGTRERVERQRIADRFPGCGARLPLAQIGDLLGRPGLALRVSGISLAGAAVGQALSDAGPPALIALSGAPGPKSGRAVLALPSTLARELVDRVLGRPVHPVAAPLTSGEQGALLFVLDRAGADWLEAGGAPFRVLGFLADPEQIRDYLGEAVRWRVALAVEGVSAGPEAQLCLGEPPASAGAKPRRPVTGPARHWPVALRVSVGRSRILLSELEALEAGDLVVLDEGSVPWLDGGAPQVALCCGAWKRFGWWRDRQRIALLSEEEREEIMTEKTGGSERTVALEAPVAAGAAALEVVVEVEIGVLRMPVESAAALVPGQILRLDREIGPEVVLKVGDRPIGRGEIVEHEGRLAVEVTEVA